MEPAMHEKGKELPEIQDYRTPGVSPTGSGLKDGEVKASGEKTKKNESCGSTEAVFQKFPPYLAAAGAGFDPSDPGVYPELRGLSGTAHGFHGL